MSGCAYPRIVSAEILKLDGRPFLSTVVTRIAILGFAIVGEK